MSRRSPTRRWCRRGRLRPTRCGRHSHSGATRRRTWRAHARSAGRRSTSRSGSATPAPPTIAAPGERFCGRSSVRSRRSRKTASPSGSSPTTNSSTASFRATACSCSRKRTSWSPRSSVPLRRSGGAAAPSRERSCVAVERPWRDARCGFGFSRRTPAARSRHAGPRQRRSGRPLRRSLPRPEPIRRCPHERLPLGADRVGRRQAGEPSGAAGGRYARHLEPSGSGRSDRVASVSPPPSGRGADRHAASDRHVRRRLPRRRAAVRIHGACCYHAGGRPLLGLRQLGDRPRRVARRR
jgi:hypothetical protein